jgi:TPR repeat protein
LARGDSLFGVGDLASARLFYERAADAGNGEAALRLGETYDPNFLERTRVRAVLGDLAAAVFWYRRARDLGVAEAEILTGAIMAGQLTAAGVATTTGPSPEAAGTILTTAQGAPPTGAAPIVADRPSAIRSGARPTAVDLERIRRHARYGNRSHHSDHRSGSPSDHMARQLNVQESGRVSRWRGGLSGWSGGFNDASRESGN